MATILTNCLRRKKVVVAATGIMMRIHRSPGEGITGITLGIQSDNTYYTDYCE